MRKGATIRKPRTKRDDTQSDLACVRACRGIACASRRFVMLAPRADLVTALHYAFPCFHRRSFHACTARSIVYDRFDQAFVDFTSRFIRLRATRGSCDALRAKYRHVNMYFSDSIKRETRPRREPHLMILKIGTTREENRVKFAEKRQLVKSRARDSLIRESGSPFSNACSPTL